MGIERCDDPTLPSHGEELVVFTRQELDAGAPVAAFVSCTPYVVASLLDGVDSHIANAREALDAHRPAIGYIMQAAKLVKVVGEVSEIADKRFPAATAEKLLLRAERNRPRLQSNL